MQNPFNELLKKREELQEAELTNEQSDKLWGDCYPGCKVKIYWSKKISGDSFYDEGYVFIGDGMFADEGDCFVHVLRPQNPNGIGDAPQEFAYMIDLIQNPLVTKIVCK